MTLLKKEMSTLTVNITHLNNIIILKIKKSINMLFVQVSLKAEIGMKSSMDLTLFEKRKEMTEVKKLEGKERGNLQ